MAHEIDYDLILILLGIGIVFLSTLLLVSNIPAKKFNCNNVIFLKPSEASQASRIARMTHALVVIPEENEVIGNMEFIQNCPNSDLLKYVQFNGLLGGSK